MEVVWPQAGSLCYGGVLARLVRSQVGSLCCVLLLTLGHSQGHAHSLAAIPSIHYQLSMPAPHTHLLEVDITFAGLEADDDPLDLILPVWRPGRYLILDFAGAVQEFSAYRGDHRDDRTDPGKALPWSKVDKTTWRINTRGQPVVSASYKVYADEFNLRTRGLNDQHAFVDGSSVFMYAEKFRHQPLTLQVHPFGDWHVTTGLDRVNGKSNLFHAPDYDYFIDCPLEIGNQKEYEFEVEGKKHYLSLSGSGNWDPEKLLERLQKVVQINFEFWGDLPYEHYTFLVHASPHGGGGTEHINSTIMGMRQFGFSQEWGYDRFTGLAMHELFHTWNVKRLRPAGIHPYDYKRENYSKLLWVAEGTTSYYTMILQRRAGLSTVSSVLRSLGRRIQNDRRRHGRRIQSLEASSFDAWIKFWKDSPNDHNSEVSYYSKGSDVSLMLDLEIRHRTENRASLDEVMRTLYVRFPLTGPGYTPQDFQNTVEEIGEGDYEEFFSTYVRGTAPLDFDKYLDYAGLEVKEHFPEHSKPMLGISTHTLDGKLIVRSVMAGSAAYDSGLDSGDEIVALNGFRIQPAPLNERLADFSPGDKIRLTVVRDEQLREFVVELRKSEVPDFTVKRQENATELQKRIYADWLNAAWPGEEK